MLPALIMSLKITTTIRILLLVGEATVQFMAAVRLAKAQGLAVKRVRRDTRTRGGRVVEQCVRGMSLRGCAETLKSQGGQCFEQARETGRPLGGVDHRRQHHFDGQARFFAILGNGLWRKTLISWHNEHNVLIWCGFGYPQK